MIVIRKEDDGRGGRPDNSSMKHIHITKTKRSKLQEKQPKRNSQPIPIPINQSPPSYKELEREATSHDSYLQYDMATWRMHNRITSARRLRADSLCYSSSPSSNGNDERYAAAARHKLMQYYCYQQLYLEVVVPIPRSSSTGQDGVEEVDAVEETTIHSLSTTDEDKSIDGQDEDKSIDDGVFMFEIA